MMKLKDRVVMILLLGSMLLCTLFGSMIVSGKKKETVPDLKPETDEPVVVPSNFLGSIEDEYNVPEEVLKPITDYMDAYYLSIFTLELQDMKDCFSNERMEEISEKSIALMIDVRKLYDFDFSLTKAHYDLKVSAYRKENNLYYVDLLEDDYMSYAFLKGIESQAFEIENSFVIKEDEGKYRIEDLEKIQGYYMAFYEDDRSPDEVYDYYYSELRDMNIYHDEVLRRKASQEAYHSDRSVSGQYDRSAAVAYLDRFYRSRNPEWYNFTDEGGNCQNYASQALLAGGIPMDYVGEEQWKCYISDPDYDPEINEADSPSGRTRSWVNVGYFYNYAKYNEGEGLAAETDANLYYAEPGDIIMVGNGGLSHTVMVSKVVDGHILVNSNSIDMKDYPIEAYTYTNLTLIKILGYN